jgi:hypothetical protein
MVVTVVSAMAIAQNVLSDLLSHLLKPLQMTMHLLRKLKQSL